MALTLLFADNDVGKIPCPNTLDCAACGGQPPYTFTITLGSITKLSGTTARITPPASSGGAGDAYKKAALHSETSGGGNSCINLRTVRQIYGCDDQLLSDWSCGGFTCFPDNTGLDCRGGAFSLCSQLPNCAHGTWTLSSAECLCTHISTHVADGTCIPIICDVRTDPMIAAGCNPCGISMNGAVVTVTDKNGVSVNRTLST